MPDHDPKAPKLTAEDFERARADCARIGNADPKSWVKVPAEAFQNIARCLEAAERKVAAWGPTMRIAVSVAERYENTGTRRQSDVHAIATEVRRIPSYMKPESRP